METQKIADALEALNWLADRATELHPDAEQDANKAAQMSLYLRLATIYVTEYLHHVNGGMEPFDALLDAAIGRMKLPESFRSVLLSVIPNDDAPEGPNINEGEQKPAAPSVSDAWNKVRDEARALGISRGLGNLLMAVDAYGDARVAEHERGRE
jgi:hypothetical protein